MAEIFLSTLLTNAEKTSSEKIHAFLESRRMTDDEIRIMNKYGITYETRTVFFWRAHRYEKLSDAVKNAELQRKNNQENNARFSNK